MNQPNIGHLIDSTSAVERDAIHMAVAPVLAGERLPRGSHVVISDSGKAMLWRPNSSIEAERHAVQVGIVDPFLDTPAVFKGERFWLLLYPGTITSLRHDWSHPAFNKQWVGAASASEEWLRSFAMNDADLPYEEMMQAARNFIEHDSYLCEGEKWDGFSLPDEFWDHYTAVTGLLPKDRWSFFSCSCD